MLVVMQAHATEEQIRAVCQKIEVMGYRPHAMPGATRTAIGVTGNQGEVEQGTLGEMPGVQEVIRVSKPYKLVSRDVKEENTVLRFAGTDATIGGKNLAVIAGPCAIESRDQAFAVAERVARAGAQFFRGGAYKPRTSPYTFQGLGEAGLRIMAEIRERFGLKIITEAIDNESLALVAEYADVIQIGARNMQNFSLLKRAGRAKKPVMVKRGMSATLEEFLMAAEYVMSEYRAGGAALEPFADCRGSKPWDGQAEQSHADVARSGCSGGGWIDCRSAQSARQGAVGRSAVVVSGTV
jgi:3-deoxy-7-phosphoheptulonate synthase